MSKCFLAALYFQLHLNSLAKLFVWLENMRKGTSISLQTTSTTTGFDGQKGLE